MSWLSSWLDKQGGVGKGLNAIGGPLVKAAGTVGNEIPVVGSIIRAGNAIGDYIPGGPSDIPNVGAVGTRLPGGGTGANPVGDLLHDPLGLLAVGNSAYMGDKANNFAKLAGESADREWARRAPVRDAGLAGMTAAPRTLPQLGAIRTSGANPFATGG